ncbi:MAG: hypothetical protein AAF413_00490 [Patescibacteria group bacterium]
MRNQPSLRRDRFVYDTDKHHQVIDGVDNLLTETGSKLARAAGIQVSMCNEQLSYSAPNDLGFNRMFASTGLRTVVDTGGLLDAERFFEAWEGGAIMLDYRKGMAVHDVSTHLFALLSIDRCYDDRILEPYRKWKEKPTDRRRNRLGDQLHYIDAFSGTLMDCYSARYVSFLRGEPVSEARKLLGIRTVSKLPKKMISDCLEKLETMPAMLEKAQSMSMASPKE